MQYQIEPETALDNSLQMVTGISVGKDDPAFAKTGEAMAKKVLEAEERLSSLLDQFIAKFTGRHILLVINQRCRAGFRSLIIDFRCSIDPVIQDLAISVIRTW